MVQAHDRAATAAAPPPNNTKLGLKNMDSQKILFSIYKNLFGISQLAP